MFLELVHEVFTGYELRTLSLVFVLLVVFLELVHDVLTGDVR